MRRTVAAAKYFCESCTSPGVHRHGQVGPLICLGRDDHAHQGAEVVAAGDELVGQVIERFGMAGRVVVAEVIDRIDEAAAEQLGPDAVDKVPREEAVLRAVICLASSLRSSLAL